MHTWRTPGASCPGSGDRSGAGRLATHMLITRRRWLALTTGGVSGAFCLPIRSQAQDRLDVDLQARISRAIDEFQQQGFHRTGTTVDRRSGDWLCEEVRRIGLVPARESFSLSRIDPVQARLVVEDRSIEGLPLFDGTFTDADGLRGRLGPLDSDAEIGLAEAAPNSAAAGPLGDARRQHRHKAIVCLTRGGRPGLCPSNADSFLSPFGPPVLQVSSDESSALREHAQRRTPVQLIAVVKKTRAEAINVTAVLNGGNPTLPPLVVMTPRSGWYACASERGGGIACWLELMRSLRLVKPARNVVFVASSGHELGHLGINAFVDRRPNIVTNAVGWMHFGANIGAAIVPAEAGRSFDDGAGGRNATSAGRQSSPIITTIVEGGGTTIQASDDDFEAMLSGALRSAQLGIRRRVPRGTVPGGEAEVVHRGGGRYLSVIGSNALFHNPEDRGVRTVDPSAIARFTKAFAAVGRTLAAG